ncbi:MAG: family 43 glycosylhydrolase [Clostridia bacterium]|jgi:GH43 family beta-xylosidase|nr:family 43 glycosylhydrolase [Clostridia bacterium]
MKPYLSPLVLQRADPYLCKHNGKYYFTATCPEYDRIELRCADTVNGIAQAEARVVWTKHESGELACHIWAPELHYVMGKWVIYFAAGHIPEIWKIRPYALICTGDDPMKDEWVEGGMMQPADGDEYSFTDFSLDMTVFEHKKKWYAIWAQKFGTEEAPTPISNLYIAEMESPVKLKTVLVLLTTPDYDWERQGGFWVNEGPAVLKNNGRIYCTFSASATGACYCMGLLSIDENDDLLDPRRWVKSRYPVMKTDESLQIYGPGHNSFTTGDDGEVITLLHFRNYEKITGDPLDDHNRHAHVMKVQFGKDGAPLFVPDPAHLYNTPFENEKQKNINA